MSSLAAIPQPEFIIKVLNGSDKGTIYKLLAGRVTIGRGNDNLIIIKDDPKVSRNHAVIIVKSTGVEISDVSDKNKIYVNGDEVSSRELTPGMVIQLGETKFQFKNLAEEISKPLATRSNLGLAPDLLKPRRKSQPQNSKLTFYIIVAIVGLLLVWLLNSKAKINVITDLRTDQDVQTDITASQKLVADTEAERNRLGLNSKQFEAAQPNFIKGFRDYRKGQYERAIDSFQACLSLFPDHMQCQRYLSLSRKKFSELIQYQIVLARKYREQSQFSACRSAYRNAMVMVKDPSDKRYQEAKAGFDACESLEGERY